MGLLDATCKKGSKLVQRKDCGIFSVSKATKLTTTVVVLKIVNIVPNEFDEGWSNLKLLAVGSGKKNTQFCCSH